MKQTIKRTSVIGISAAVAAGALAIVPSAPAWAQPGAGCAPKMAYMVPGTTETNPKANPSEPKGLLKEVGNIISERLGDQVKVVYVPYSASAFDKGLTYEGSEQQGVNNAAKLIAQCPNSDIVISGYSQGAQVAGDIAWHIGNSNKPIAADRVKGVGLLADPLSGQQAVVGNARTGTGIAGGRPGGYGALEGLIKWVCDDKDMYCNVESKNPFVKTIGTLISTGGTGKVAALDGAKPSKDLDPLVTDFSNVDLTGAKSNATDLKTRTQALAESKNPPTKEQLGKISELATSLNSTYSQTDKAVSLAKESGATTTLEQAKPGTPEAETVPVVNAVNQTDMGELVKSTGDVASMASSLSNSSDLGNAGESLKSMALSGASIAQNSGLLNSVDSGNLSAATSVLGTLNFGTIIDTAMSAATTALSTDYQGIIDKVGLLGTQLAAMDAKAAHKTAGELNTMMEPWVDFAAAANTQAMPMAASVVGMIPDPYGIAPIASIAMNLMSKVDIKALANVVGQAQEVAWAVVEGKPEQALNLVPIGVSLAGIGLGALTGQGGAGSAPGTGGAPMDISGLAKMVSGAGAPNDLGQLVTDGLSFASFLNSGAHTSAYTNKAMVGGRSGVDYLGEYLTQKLEGQQAGDSSSSRSDSGERSGSPAVPSQSAEPSSGKSERDARENDLNSRDSGSARSVAPSVPSAAPATPASKVDALKSFGDVKFSQPVGLAVAAPGGGAMIAGDQAVRPAWSTSKVPVALAATRKSGSVPAAATAAIEASDNASAESMWGSLGNPAEASTATTEALRSGGDRKTSVPAERSRSEYTAFGQTKWGLPDAATFSSNMACMKDATGLISLMGAVDSNQQWGAWKATDAKPAVKGGWGPAEDGSYTVRQIGVLTKPDGTKVGVALSTFAPGGTLDSGIAALNQAGDWLSKNVSALPSAKCM